MDYEEFQVFLGGFYASLFLLIISLGTLSAFGFIIYWFLSL